MNIKTCGQKLPLHNFGDGYGPVPAHRHINGGGWVADTAYVSPVAYIGSNAAVCGDAKVCGNAKVYDGLPISGGKID